MSKIVYKRATQRWNKYDSYEKYFLIFCIILVLAIWKLPIFVIKDGDIVKNTTSMLGASNGLSMILTILALTILIAWNLSYRFKNLVGTYFGFRENDGFINFSILLFLIGQLLAAGSTILFVKDKFSSQIDLSAWYLGLGILISIGLLWNLALTLNNAIKRNKPGKTYIETSIGKDDHLIIEKESGLFDPKDL